VLDHPNLGSNLQATCISNIAPLLLCNHGNHDTLPELPLVLVGALGPFLLDFGIVIPPKLVCRLNHIITIRPALPRLVQDIVQDLDVSVFPQVAVASPHWLESVVRVGQRLPFVAVHNGQQVLVKEQHLGNIGMRVHGINEGIILFLGRLQDDSAAVEKVMVARAGLGDGLRFTRFLVCRCKATVLGDPRSVS